MGREQEREGGVSLGMERGEYWGGAEKAESQGR